MHKYLDYIKESVGNFKKGDKVIFNPNPNRSYYNIHKGSECEIMFVYIKDPNGKMEQEYSIKTPTGVRITALESELTPVGTEKSTGDKTMNYIENQFKSPIPPTTPPSYFDPSKSQTENDVINDKLPVGTKVTVTGKQGAADYKERKGIVKKSAGQSYLIEFEEDESKNQSSFVSLVDMELVTPIEGQIPPTQDKVKNFEINDIVKCVDKTSPHFGQIGKVDNYWADDNTYMVNFIDEKTVIFMDFNQLVPSSGTKKVKFNEPIPVSGPKLGVTPTTQKPPVVEMEEEDEDEVTNITTVPFKKEDLLEFSYADFLLEEKISTHEDLLTLKTKYQSEIDNPELSKIKKVYYEKTLGTIDIIESYFQFLIAKVAKDVPVLRTVEQIEDKDLLRTKTKVRASDSKELTRKYSFDQGIIAYWKFKDAVVFRTI